MSYSGKAISVMRNWNKKECIETQHPEQILICETEFVYLDAHVDNMKAWTLSEEYANLPKLANEPLQVAKMTI